MAAKEKTNFEVVVDFQDTLDGDRFDVSVSCAIRDDETEFCDFTFNYPGQTPEGADLLQALLVRALGAMPFQASGLTETQFVKLERKLIELQKKLNNYAWWSIGKTSDQKRVLTKKLLRENEIKRSKKD